MIKWQWWAVSEGLSKTVSGILQKFVGLATQSGIDSFLYTLIIGVIQMFSGLVGFCAKNKPEIILYPDRRTILWAIAFGFFATVMTALGAYTFLLGADLSVRTLIIVSSIVPGAIIGKIFWNDPFGVREIFGISIFLVAVWSMLDFPSWSVFITLPSWVWLTFIIMLSGAVNEALSRVASVKLDPWVNNFWVGVSTTFFSALGLVALGFSGESMKTSHAFWLGSILIGAVVVAMVSFKLLAYKGGGTIALKKLIMQGVYLLTVSVAGVAFYNEPVTLGKIAGICLFLLAFVITDKETGKVAIELLRRTKLP